MAEPEHRDARDVEQVASLFDGRVRLYRLPVHADRRGTLRALHFAGNPFEPRRIFCIEGVPPGTSRGGHAHRSAEQLLVRISGEIVVELHFGTQDSLVVLDDAHPAVWIGPGVWSRQVCRDERAALVVLSTEDYDPTSYIAERQQMRSGMRWWRRLGRPEADVSICIPTYMAAAFIENTLRFAAGQTYRRIAILVSVDQSSDATAELCRKHARSDPRITVFEQDRRLGWAANVNFLLERVRTPYFFLYFHDDILLPQYTETLLRRLEQRPDAASIHCDMGHFGASEHVSIARPFEGTGAERLMGFLLAPTRGSPLRSLTRSRFLPSLRLPTDAVDGLWANEPYLMRLVAAGPALHVDETLYMRWDKRVGGLTDGWKNLSPEQILSGHKANIRTAMSIFEEAKVTSEERDALVFSLLVSSLPRLRHVERELGVSLFDDAAELHPAFAAIRPPESLASIRAELRAWALRRYEETRHIEADRLRVGRSDPSE